MARSETPHGAFEGGCGRISESFLSAKRRPFGVSMRRESSSLSTSPARIQNGSVTVESCFPGTPRAEARRFTRRGPSRSSLRYLCSSGPKPSVSSCSSSHALSRSAAVLSVLPSARATLLAEAVSLKAAPKPVTSEEGGVNKKSTVAANAGAKGPIGNSVKPVHAGGEMGGRHDTAAYSNSTKELIGRVGNTPAQGTQKPSAATKPSLGQAAGVNTKSPVARG